jgi:hypothetical protein
VDGDDAKDVVLARDDERLEPLALVNEVGHRVEQGGVGPLEGERVDLPGSDDHELGQVDRIRALAQDPALRAALATGH